MAEREKKKKKKDDTCEQLVVYNRKVSKKFDIIYVRFLTFEYA